MERSDVNELTVVVISFVKLRKRIPKMCNQGPFQTLTKNALNFSVQGETNLKLPLVWLIMLRRQQISHAIQNN